MVAEPAEGFPAAFLPLKMCSWDMEFAIPENTGLLLYQWQEQEAERLRVAEGFRMLLDECTKGIIWRGWWWSQETGLDKAASLFKSDVPKRFSYLTEEKRGGEKKAWMFLCCRFSSF